MLEKKNFKTTLGGFLYYIKINLWMKVRYNKEVSKRKKDA
jgi:hypothetical protein